MAFCGNCGTKFEDGAKFCPSCGAAAGAPATPMAETAQAASAAPVATAAPAAPEGAAAFDPADIEKNKAMAGLAYFLFFLPLVSCPDSPYGRYHANQGLVLLLFSVIGSIVLGIIPIIGWIILLFFPIVVVVFAIMGLMNGLNGRAKPLPLIGKIIILK